MSAPPDALKGNNEFLMGVMILLGWVLPTRQFNDLKPVLMTLIDVKKIDIFLFRKSDASN
jgi:hypothetical protein